MLYRKIFISQTIFYRLNTRFNVFSEYFISLKTLITEVIKQSIKNVKIYITLLCS